MERLKQRLEESPEVVFTDRTPGPGLRDILDGVSFSRPSGSSQAKILRAKPTSAYRARSAAR